MRPDFGRVVIEKERRGSSNKSAKARRFGRIVFDAEDGHEYYGETKIPLGRRAEAYHPGRGEKEFSDVLGPLNGYLRKSVGRKWDDVYSELCQNLGRFSWPLRHILTQHVDVATNTYMGEDGKIYGNGSRGFLAGLIGEVGSRHYNEFYVDPRNGILRFKQQAVSWRAIWRARNKERKDTDRKPLTDGRWIVKIKDLWFIGAYQQIEMTEPATKPEWPDLIITTYKSHRGGWRSRMLWHFMKEKQANKKEMTQAGIS